MSIVLAREAFTAAGRGLRLERLELHYAVDGNNSQVMDVTGYRYGDAAPFAASSGPVDPRTSPQEIARALAAKVLAQQHPAPAARLDSHLTETIDQLKSGQPLMPPPASKEIAMPDITEGVDPPEAPVPTAVPEAPAPAAMPVVVVPTRAPVRAPVRTSAADVPAMPELYSLMGNLGMMARTVEGACARLNLRMGSIGMKTVEGVQKFDRALDTVENTADTIHAAANQLANGGPPLGRSKE